MNRHLTSEEVSQWMMGERTPEQQEHLLACVECAAEIERIQAPLALFRGAVREWSADEQNRPGAIPARSWPGALLLRFTATVAVLVVLIAIGIGGRNRRAARIEAEDDALLGRVQTAVSRSVPAPMEPLYNLMAEESTK